MQVSHCTVPVFDVVWSLMSTKSEDTNLQMGWTSADIEAREWYSRDFSRNHTFCKSENSMKNMFQTIETEC